ncbi:MAG: carbohydrate ABC transporter permease [bacterium]
MEQTINITAERLGKIMSPLAKNWLAYALVLPALAWVLLFVIYPVFYSIQISFYNMHLLRPVYRFVGLATYHRVLSSKVTSQVLKNTLIWVGGGTFATMVIGVWMGIFLSMNYRVNRFLAAIILIPWILPDVICGGLWKWMFHSELGVINAVLMQFGILKQAIPFLGQPSTALFVCMFIIVWRLVPFVALITLAAIQGIPLQFFEAAEIDGASGWKKIRYITLPLLKYPITIGIVLSLVWILENFTIVWVTTKGGPMNFSEVITTHIYRLSFIKYKVSEGAVLGLFGFGLIFIVTLIYLRIFKKFWLEET